MVNRRQLFLQAVVVVSFVLSVEEFLRNHQIPILILDQSLKHDDPKCYKNICNCSSDYITGPYIAPGPSEIQPLVPMSVLKTNMHFDSYDGLKYLSHASLSRFYQCQPSSTKTLLSDIKWCSERRFRNQELPLVALVSFHGSGNTWLRYMLEQATGIFSGSIYCDSILKSVFPGESVASGNVIVIKTHHSDCMELPKDIQLATKQQKYDKAIVLVRNPFDALVSEANRRWNSKRAHNDHIGLANEASFISKQHALIEYTNCP